MHLASSYVSTQPEHLGLDERLARLRTPLPDAKYFSLTITADGDGRVEWATYSKFDGWHDRERRIELRRARSLDGSFAQTFWADLGQPFAIIHSAEHLSLYLIAGGNALIERTLAQESLPEFFGPQLVAQDGPLGFKSIDSFDASALNHAPTRKLRMNILKRDDRRCRVCGRRPDDYVDVELHVHHIRPWSRGGLTEPLNLITLCHTCHKGLDPHEDLSLYEYTRPDDMTIDVEQGVDRLLSGIVNYRKIIYEHMLPAVRGDA